MENGRKDRLLTHWRSVLQATRWRQRESAGVQCRRCGWCWTSIDLAVGEVLVEERGVIVLCVCTTCRPNLTIIAERRDSRRR